jgi:hypothetical protein
MSKDWVKHIIHIKNATSMELLTLFLPEISRYAKGTFYPSVVRYDGLHNVCTTVHPGI